MLPADKTPISSLLDNLVNFVFFLAVYQYWWWCRNAPLVVVFVGLLKVNDRDDRMDAPFGRELELIGEVVYFAKYGNS